MQPINMPLSDAEQVKLLDKECMRLHLMPSPRMHYSIEVQDSNGEVITSIQDRSKSWNRAAYNQIAQTLLGLGNGTNGAGRATLGQISTTGTTLSSTNPNIVGTGANLGSAGGDTVGIVVGASDVPETFYGKSLCAKLGHGTTETDSILLGSGGFIPYTPGGCGWGDSQYPIPVDPVSGYCLIQLAASPYYAIGQASSGVLIIDEGKSAALPTISGIFRRGAWSRDGQYLALLVNNALLIFSHDGQGGLTKLDNSAFPAIVGTISDVGWIGNYFVYSSSTSPYVYTWLNTNGVFTSGISVPAASGTPYWIAVSPNDLYLATQKDGVVNVFSLVDNVFTLISTLTSSGSGCHGLKWNTDNYLLALFGNVSASVPAFYGYSLSEGVFTLTGTGFIPSSGNGPPSPVSDGTYIFVSATSSGCLILKFVEGIISVVTSNLPRLFTGSTVYSTLFNFVKSTLVYSNNYQCFISDPPFPRLSYQAQSSPTIVYSAETNTTMITYTRIFNNNSSVSAFIKEMGIYTSGSLGILMYNRDVLETPLEVQPGYRLTVTYTISIVYPS